MTTPAQELVAPNHSAPDRVWAWCFNSDPSGSWANWGGYARQDHLHPLDKREAASGAVYVRADIYDAALSREAALIDAFARSSEREAALREALSFYANPEVYRPHPHGIAFERRDISDIAIAALEVKP